MGIIGQLKKYVAKRNECFINVDLLEKTIINSEEKKCIERKIKQLAERNYQLAKSNVRGKIVGCHRLDNIVTLEYFLHYEFLMKSNRDCYHLEEQLQRRKATFIDGELVRDEEFLNKDVQQPPMIEREKKSRKQESRFVYDRREAVRYAERWWNDYHPHYKKFPNNCTNFVSQCLRAGGAPMAGYPHRSKGWWYQNDDWSYSWAVAHSFRWYLSGATSGLCGEEVGSPEDLLPGDVICYDFDGDGRFQHTAIVVAKDENNMPLVNAQTSNSRMRYWAYEDSTAWTPNIRYKFFRIVIL